MNDEPVRVHAATLREGAAVPAPESQRRPAPPADVGTTTDRPTVVVLPFATASGDEQQKAFADGMTDDLTTDLSKISGIVVTSRASAIAYEDRGLDLRTVARELDVRYALQGRIRAAGDRVRINAELVDWSGRSEK